MKRKPDSHKGQNGKVLIIGGNEVFHGAPILAGLGAEKSGADLVYLMVPKNQQHLARSFSANLIVDHFSGKYLRGQDVSKALDWCAKVDVLVIGNGLGQKPQTLRAVRKILQKSACKVVVDAAALPAFMKVAPLGEREVVLTPHRGELEQMEIEDSNKALVAAAQAWQATIVLKGPDDLIVSPEGKTSVNKTGDPVMTKGGTGDVLAGLIGGLMAQGLSGFDAAQQACKDWGKVGEYVAKQQGLEVTIQELLQDL